MTGVSEPSLSGMHGGKGYTPERLDGICVELIVSVSWYAKVQMVSRDPRISVQQAWAWWQSNFHYRLVIPLEFFPDGERLSLHEELGENGNAIAREGETETGLPR